MEPLSYESKINRPSASLVNRIAPASVLFVCVFPAVAAILRLRVFPFLNRSLMAAWLLVALCALLAIISGTLGLPAGRMPSPRKRGLAAVGLTLGLLEGVTLGFFPSLLLGDFIRRPAMRCPKNLSHIGTGLLRYANENGGRLPDSLSALLDDHLPPQDLICPSGKETPPRGATTHAFIADFEAGGHCSYTYLGKGMTLPLDPQVVLAYESHANHKGGIFILHADGIATYLKPAEAKRVVAKLQAGQNPPR